MTATTTMLARLREIAVRATPGYWEWRNTAEPMLRAKGGRLVMTFARFGMNGAQPVFRSADGTDYVKAGKENIVDFPDALYIATADPTTMLAILDHIDELEAQVKALATLCPCPNPDDLAGCYCPEGLDHEDCPAHREAHR